MMVLIVEEHEVCKACLGTGQTPCNGMDTGWCACEFCQGTGKYIRRISPRFPWSKTSEEREAAYLECHAVRLAWEAVQDVKRERG